MQTEPIDILGGLRKLEFHNPNDSAGESTHALIEFVREAPFPDGRPARISLGYRNGVLREVVGSPHLVHADGAEVPHREYVYRLRALITPACA
jgi:hypothetical protein